MVKENKFDDEIAQEFNFSIGTISNKISDLGLGYTRKRRCGNGVSNWNGYEEISGSIWARIKASARCKNLELSISIQYVWELFLKQNRLCALTSVKLYFPINTTASKSSNASLDRIDSSKGYIRGNVQWVHKGINRIKSFVDNELFLQICNLIAKNNPRSNIDLNNVDKALFEYICGRKIIKEELSKF